MPANALYHALCLEFLSLSCAFACALRLQVHPWQKPAMPTQEQLQQSANSPIIVTANPMMKQQTINGHVDPTHELPINGEAMSISSSMFEGKIEVHLKGLPTSQKSIFDGKKRFFQVMVQVGSS